MKEKDIFEALPFLPGEELSRRTTHTSGLLGRFLPPIESGSISSWLTENIQPGEWLLDPFGVSPRLIVEAARAGYRVLATANNPIDRFLIDLLAQPPAMADLQSAMADLGASHKGDQRIEPHILSLYLTVCDQCQQEVPAQAFIWEKGKPAPEKRVVQCPNCNTSGEFPVTQLDETRAGQFTSSGLYRARALERVARLDDPDRAFVEEAIDAYQPRALHALFTLINKLDSLPEHHRRPLSALLLSAFDQTNSLWSHPSTRSRPRQLSIPPRFREKNVWSAMEEGLRHFVAMLDQKNYLVPPAPTVPVTTWPDEPPPGGGVCIFPGRIRDLKEELSRPERVTRPESSKFPAAKSRHFAAIITAVPRPNQAYWTLSALWSGWLWGKEAVAPLKSALRRRRYDWAWHTAALSAAFTNLVELMEPATPFLGWIAEAEPGYILASLIAAQHTGLEIQGVSLRDDQKQAQVLWHKSSKKVRETQPEELSRPDGTTHQESLPLLSLQDQAAHGAINYLINRGEPSSYLQIHTTAVAAILESLREKPIADHDPSDLFSEFNNIIQQALNYRSGFVRFAGSSSSLEVGRWWVNESFSAAVSQSKPETGVRITEQKDYLAQPDFRSFKNFGSLKDYLVPNTINQSISDRVEIALVKYLQNNPGRSSGEIDRTLCKLFPGMFTPDSELINCCLMSYGEQFPDDQDAWRLRSSDSPNSRRADLLSISQLLLNLGERLGFSSTLLSPEGRVIHWISANRIEYQFYLIASAVINSTIASQSKTGGSKIIVYPGSRASLIEYKLHHNPRLESFVVEAGWQFVKFRHIRRLSENEQLNRDNFDGQLTLDPITNQDAQMILL